MPGCGATELARRCRIENPGAQATIPHHGERRGGYALGIEWTRAKPSLSQRIVDHLDAIREQLVAQAISQKARLARDRRTVDAARQVANQRAGHPTVEDDWHARAFHLAGIEALHGALASPASNLLRA